ncbi:response regulator [Nocardioides caldifontis]|uniref:response regulator n=1 Tax=Nocardioides caldifontis TaxID=2588938 RepID=UPI001939A16F|nr:response regulator transcription factor [Nocardioides caldifontis]
MSVRVLLVDDNPVVRIGLRSLLELDDRMDVCGEASSGQEAVAVASRERPDVVLLDVRMPGSGGLDVLPALTQLSRVLMLTYSDEPAVVSEALRGGATGYLVHGAFQSDELAMAIIDTAEGRPRLSPAAASVLLQGFHGGGTAVAEAPATHDRAEPTVVPEVVKQHALSRREVEICRLLVAGMSNGDIARRLFIEEKTVKNHLNRIFAKLGAANRAEAIATCLGTRRGA